MSDKQGGRDPAGRSPSSPGSPGSRRASRSASSSNANPALDLAAGSQDLTGTHDPTSDLAGTIEVPFGADIPHASTTSTTDLPQTVAAAALTTTTVIPALSNASGPQVRPAIAPASVIPTAPELTAAEQDRLDRDLQHRLWPQPSFRTFRRQALLMNNWDLTAAHTQYTQVLTLVLRGRAHLPPGTMRPGSIGPNNRDGTLFLAMDARGLRRMLGPLTFEEQVRVMVRVFLEEMNRNRATPMKPKVTSVLLTLLHHNFDLDGALAAWESPDVARATLHATFDHFRPPFATDHVATVAGEEQERQDESLAYLLRLTGRGDWFSVRAHLMKYHWNLVNAIKMWYSQGIPETKADRGLTHKTRCNHKYEYLTAPDAEDIKPRSAVGNWAQETKEFMSEKEYADGLLLGTFKEPEELERHSEKSRKGVPFSFLLDPLSKEDIFPGPPDPKRMHVEFIRKGRYQFTRFQDKSFSYPELDPSGSGRQADDPPDFDWSNAAHIDKLNKWLKQVYRRVTGILGRRAAQKWTKEEKEFLYELHLERLDELEEKHEGEDMTEEQLLKIEYGMACMDGWAERMNKEFPREYPRNGRAIDTMRRRIREIVERFNVKADRKFVPLVAGEEQELFDTAPDRDKGEEVDEQLDGAQEGEDDGGEGPSGGESRKRKRGDEDNEDEAEAEE